MMHNIIWEDIEHVPMLLDRVKHHFLLHRPEQRRMSNAKEEVDANDLKYLSRMVFKTNCSNPVYNMEWFEWIEPLTVRWTGHG